MVYSKVQCWDGIKFKKCKFKRIAVMTPHLVALPQIRLINLILKLRVEKYTLQNQRLVFISIK